MAQTEWEDEYEEKDGHEQIMRTLDEEELYNGAYKRKQKVYEKFEEFSGRVGSIDHTEKERPVRKEEKAESAYQPGGTLGGDGTNTANGTGSNSSPKQEDMQSPPPPPTEPNVPVSDAIPLVIVSGIGYAAWKLKRASR